MMYRSYWLLLACILIWFGYKMLRENWQSLDRREGMYDKESSDIAFLSGIPMIVLGGVIMLAGLALLAFRLARYVT